MSKVNSKKRFQLPGSNKQQPPPTTKQPGVIQLTAENAPIWQAKFMEEIRDELRKMNRFLETHAQ